MQQTRFDIVEDYQLHKINFMQYEKLWEALSSALSTGETVVFAGEVKELKYGVDKLFTVRLAVIDKDGGFTYTHHVSQWNVFLETALVTP